VTGERQDAPDETPTTQDDSDLVKLELEAEIASSAAFAAAVMDASAGSLERSRAGADTVQKSATAIFALYTGALTLAFSVTDQPLPLRGAIPGLFLGAAIALAAGYVAFLGRSAPVEADFRGGSAPVREMKRTTFFTRWVNESVLRRGHWLRTAVCALLIGVAALPLPFLTLPEQVTATSAQCPAETDRDEASGACLPTWPTIPEGTAADVTLRTELFEAQVAEAAAARESARAEAQRSPDDTAWVLGFTGAGVVLCVLAFFWDRWALVRGRRAGTTRGGADRHAAAPPLTVPGAHGGG